MSALKPRILCVIIGGYPKNIGLIAEVLEHIGPYPPRSDAYSVRTVTGRNFSQLKLGKPERLESGSFTEAITDRHKLRPLVDPRDDPEETDTVEKPAQERKKKITASLS